MAILLKWLPMIITFFLLMVRVPVAVSFFSGALIYFTFICHDLSSTAVIQKMVTSGMNPTFLAVPFFITAGVVMNYGGISEKVMDICNCIVGHRKGGLAKVNVLLSTLMGGICGSSGADCACECKILVPEMVRHGYTPGFSAAVTAASSLISPIIPPGTSLILYASMTGCSVVAMYYAGYLPGILLCIIQLLVIDFIAFRKHFKPDRDHRATKEEFLHSLKKGWPALLMPLVMLLGVRTGWFTPTEGGLVLIVMCAIIGAFVFRNIRKEDIMPLLLESLSSTVNVSMIIVSAVLFGLYLSWERIPQNIASALINFTDSRAVFLILANVMLLIMGMFLDGTAVLMIATPLLFPAAQAYGIDLIHFGIIMVLNIQTGGLTPPFGGVMYISCHLCHVEIPDFVKNVIPFLIGVLIEIILISAIPAISLALPRLLY